MNFCGIDPGLKGALVLIGGDERPLAIKPMPLLGGKIDENLLSLWLHNNAYLMDARVALENVNSFGGMGSTSIFTFASGWGLLRGIMAAKGIPYELVIPTTWQKGIPGKGKASGKALKEVWQAEALRRCPALYDTALTNGKPLNKEHRFAVADAYLMACWRARLGNHKEEKQ